MNIIGLTGGIASGKTTVSDYIAHLDIPIIDADVINRHLLQPNNVGYQQIVRTFSNIPLLSDGSLDKVYLRNKIFTDKLSKKRLEKILHPLITSEIKSQIKKHKIKNLYPYCIVSVPIMIEANFLGLVSSLWVTDCSEKIQLKRLMERDKITQEDARLIMSHQLSRQERLQYADQVINTENESQMIEKIKYLHHQQILLNS